MKPLTKRQEEMLALSNGGASAAKIAELYGITADGASATICEARRKLHDSALGISSGTLGDALVGILDEDDLRELYCPDTWRLREQYYAQKQSKRVASNVVTSNKNTSV